MRLCEQSYAFEPANHSLLIFLHVPKTSGTTVRASLGDIASPAKGISCVAGMQFQCDRSDDWRKKHRFLEFESLHDQQFFEKDVAPHLDALRAKYVASGGRVVVWMNMRDPIERAFSDYYMWSSNYQWVEKRRVKIGQLSFAQWLLSRPHLNRHVLGIGASKFDTTACNEHKLAELVQKLDYTVPMNCTTSFVTSLRQSLSLKAKSTRSIYPGSGRYNSERTRWNWTSITDFERNDVINKIACDRKLCAMTKAC